LRNAEFFSQTCEHLIDPFLFIGREGFLFEHLVQRDSARARFDLFLHAMQYGPELILHGDARGIRAAAAHGRHGWKVNEAGGAVAGVRSHRVCTRARVVLLLDSIQDCLPFGSERFALPDVGGERRISRRDETYRLERPRPWLLTMERHHGSCDKQREKGRLTEVTSHELEV
jgi:hypothetical protein